MLNDARRLVYWDACVALSYINGELERLPHLRGLLADDSVQLITSVLSITEVAWAKHEQDSKELTQEAEDAIKALWEIESPIELVEFHELIAEAARDLMRKGIPLGWNLRPADAIHLATADRLGVSEFQSYDSRLTKYKQLTHTQFPINEPTASQPTLRLTWAPDKKEASASTSVADEQAGKFEQEKDPDLAVARDNAHSDADGANRVHRPSSTVAAQVVIEHSPIPSSAMPSSENEPSGLAK